LVGPASTRKEDEREKKKLENALDMKVNRTDEGGVRGNEKRG